MSAKKYYYNNLITKSNNKPKTTWNIVKTITKIKKTANNITIMSVNNKPTNNPLTIVNAFNSYFLSVAENLLKKKFSKPNTTNNNDPLFYLKQNTCLITSQIKLKNTTTYEVNKIIQSIKSKNSSGYDEISSGILKISAPYIISPLRFIFNKILNTGIFSGKIKISRGKTFT